MAEFHPTPSKDELVERYVGKSLQDILTPSVVLDLNIVKKNCARMLEAVGILNFGWRAHIKTHKTLELTRLQVGEGNGPVNIIVSTLAEAEYVLPLLLEYKLQSRPVNVLYSFPVTPISVARLSNLAKALGPHGLSLMIDNTAQLNCIKSIYQASSIAPDVFLKIDMGTHRAGVLVESEAASTLSQSLLSLTSSGICYFCGLYAHAGHSYYGSDKATAINLLQQELDALLKTSHFVQPSKQLFLNQPFVLSVGATPTTSSIRNLLVDEATLQLEEAEAIRLLKSTITSIQNTGCTLEVHAGVYPVLDIQQLSTHALPTSGPQATTFEDIGITVLAEVASTYPGRGANGSTEVLIGTGTLALGREPCKAYPGWGILTPWNRSSSADLVPKSAETFSGWIIGRISQEHGIVTYLSRESDSKVAETGLAETFEVGQKVRIWPNHACVAGAGYSWYYVVDGSDQIIDIWVRCRGW